MRPVKIAIVIGARPQFVKAAALATSIAARNERTTAIDEIVIHTGQHYDHQMSAVFFQGLKLPTPHYHLGVGSASHGKQTAAILASTEEVLENERPDIVLVFGDTNSTLAGALAAVKLQIPVAHVEAGLRSGRLDMPEEVNRVIVDRIATHLFCPTETAVQNLDAEGLTNGVVRTGDVMLDVLLANRPAPDDPGGQALLAKLGIAPREYALATIHRAGNTDDEVRLRALFFGLSQLAASGLPVLCPLHPRTSQALEGHSGCSGVQIIEPVGYREMLFLTQSARVILTDSGGVQKEAFWLGVPCVTLREETEWPETLEEGWNVLAGADARRIATAALRATPAIEGRSAFGDGTASKRIVDILLGEGFGGGLWQ